MDTEYIKAKDYITADDLMKIIPNLKKYKALEYINDAIKEMEQKGYYVPVTRPKVALTKIIKKKFGW